jgi:hypothetical protein
VVAAVSEANMPAVAAAALIAATRDWAGIGAAGFRNERSAIMGRRREHRRGPPDGGPALASPAARGFGWLSRKWSQMRFVRRAGENK